MTVKLFTAKQSLRQGMKMAASSPRARCSEQRNDEPLSFDDKWIKEVL